MDEAFERNHQAAGDAAAIFWADDAVEPGQTPFGPIGEMPVDEGKRAVEVEDNAFDLSAGDDAGDAHFALWGGESSKGSWSVSLR